MNMAQEAAQRALGINGSPDNSSSLADHVLATQVPDSEEQMCWSSSEDMTGQATAMPDGESSTDTSSTAVGPNKGDADKGGVKTVVDIWISQLTAAQLRAASWTTGEIC